MRPGLMFSTKVPGRSSAEAPRPGPRPAQWPSERSLDGKESLLAIQSILTWWSPLMSQKLEDSNNAILRPTARARLILRGWHRKVKMPKGVDGAETLRHPAH